MQVHEAKAVKDGPIIKIRGLSRGLSWTMHGLFRLDWGWCEQDGALVIRGSGAEEAVQFKQTGMWTAYGHVNVPKHLILQNYGKAPSPGSPVAIKVAYMLDGQLLPKVGAHGLLSKP